MIVFPEVQTKMQEELDREIGDNEQGTKRVTLADRAKLPYTNAVISESQRLCNLLPMNLSHKATKDVEIGGFKIAKGTVIVPNISNVLYDDKVDQVSYGDQGDMNHLDQHNYLLNYSYMLSI